MKQNILPVGEQFAKKMRIYNYLFNSLFRTLCFLSMPKMLSKCLALKLGKEKLKKPRNLPLVQEGGFQSLMSWNGNFPLLKAFVLQAMC